MPWYFPFPESIKKRACRYLLQHYLGRFLETKLGLDQLSVDLYKGTGSVKDVALDVEALNDLSEEQGIPVEFLDGSIAEVSISVPWSALLHDSSFVEIKGLCLVVHPKEQCKNAFMWESMINSMAMTTSMQLAEECLKQNEGDLTEGAQSTFEGLELFAQTLETVLARVKVRCIDTIVRLEYVPPNSLSGVGLEMRIKKIDYYDMAGMDPATTQGTNISERSAYATKKFCLEGVTLYTDEFAASAKAQSRSFSCSGDANRFSGSSEHSLDASNKDVDKTEFGEQIMCGKLSGRHEIAIRFKQCDTISGPKMELDLTFGSAIVFLSPRQVHSFLAVFQALFQPAVDITLKSKRNEKPMQPSDYRRIENELQHQIKRASAPSSGESLNRKGWSTGCLEDSDDEFHPCEAPRPVDKETETASQHLHPSSNSSDFNRAESPGDRNHSHSSRKSFNGPENHSGAIEDSSLHRRMRFSLKLGSCVALCLHEDILACNPTTGQLATPTVTQMRVTAEHFFKQLGLLSLAGVGNKDLTLVKEKLSAACTKSHLRVVMAPLNVTGGEQESNSGTTLEMSLSVAIADVAECLVEKHAAVANPKWDVCTVLSFTPQSDAGQAKPNALIKIVSHQPGRILQKVRHPVKPEMHITIQLSPCTLEVDMSIVDRVTALMNRPNFLSSPKARFSQMYQDKQPSVDDVLENDSNCHINLSVSSPKISVNLRFPIPDLRPLHDLQRTPWWHRYLRPDILTLELFDALITSTMAPHETVSVYQMVCKEVRCLYQEEAGQEAIHFLQATAQEGDSVNMAEGAGHYYLPRMTLTLRPSQVNSSELEDQEDACNDSEGEDNDVMTLSTGEALLGMASSQPSPFSKQRRIHKGKNHRDEGSNLEELVIPGSPEEMAEFSALSSKKCLRQIDISVPMITLLLPSQKFYEALYNRLSTDLCLWEPSAPEYFTGAHGAPFHDIHKPTNYGGLGSAVLQSPIPGTFIMCKSGVVYESDSESEDGESGNFSFLRNRQHVWKAKKPNKDCPSKMCVSLNVGKGLVTMFCYLKDPGGDGASHHGEVQCTIEDGKLFSVTSYKGDPQTGYVCFQAAKASLSHNGYVLNAYDDVATQLGMRMHQTSRVDQVIYPSASETVFSERSVGLPMLSVALEVHTDPRVDVKTFKTAVSISGGTLRHRFAPAAHSWFTQLTDFFDVVDFPIAGYRAPTVITELHLNLSNCGVDYRPLYLPARAFVSVGTLNVSSNIVAQTNACMLRFVVEDATLHLSNRVSFGTVNLQRDYVGVLDIDLLELSLKLNTKQPPTETPTSEKFHTVGSSPLFELQSSLNIVRIRTCADSCRLLLDLLTYLADDGDFDEKGVALSEDSSESGQAPKNKLDSRTGGSLTSLHSQEMEAQVNDLMAEAMQDATPPAPQQQKMLPKEESLPCTKEVFFFPDENKLKDHVSRSKTLGDEDAPTDPRGVWHEGVDQQLMDDALDPAFDDLPASEEEFCILENDPGIGFTPKGGEPQIRQLIGNAVQMIEGHFSPPIGKSDVLKAPKHFPTPVIRYTLREMTLIWEVFGGHDFPKHGTSSNSRIKQQRTVTFSKGNDCQEKVKIRQVSPSTSPSPISPSAGARGRNRNTNRTGGFYRQHDVKMELQMNKVRFVHEVYPDDTFQASRQVLTVGDIEVRDRLAESHINKFLYQYCCESRPRQAHASMILIKALHVRPDVHLPALECCLKVSILPLRLHIDQDTLTFMNEFSTALSEAGCYTEDEESSKAAFAAPVTAPVMGVAGEVMTPANLDKEPTNHLDSMSNAESGDSSLAPPVYFRSFTFSPDVLIRFDYHGKGVDLSQGPSLSGLLVGLGQLNCSQLTLKRLSHRHGLLGAHKLIAYAINEWLMDIKKNQLPSVMAGVGPMHSIVQLVQGIRDLFWLPVEQFQKDGRIVRGLQRGANAFSTSAALAILELTSRMVQTLQSAAETAYDVVSPGPSVRRTRPGSRGRRRRHTQPVDIRDGVAKAYQVVREGLGETAKTLVRVANEEAEQKGMTGAVGGVLRQIPPIVVKPIILATEATVNVIGGVQSQLMPDTRKEAIDKWRQDD